MFKVLPILLSMFLLISCGGGGGGSSDGGETRSSASSSENSSDATTSSSSESSESSSSVAPNEAPTANAGEDQIVHGGFTVQLSATGSADPEGETLTYEWTQVTEHKVMYVTADGTITEARDTQDLFVFIPATEAGKEYTFSLTVSDGTNTSEADTVKLTVADCVEGEGDVFIECIDPSWFGVSSYQEIDGNAGNSFYSNGIENHVNWSIVDLEDGEHNNVIDVKFLRNDSSGNFTIAAPTPENADMPAIDMTDFANGYIKFDVRAVGTTDPITLFLSIQCGYPCGTSTPWTVETLPDSEWTSVTIWVENLINLDLDVSKISTALLINPQWVNQADINFQLDNIRWEKANCDDAPNVVFSNCLIQDDSYANGWDEVDGPYGISDPAKHISWQEVFSGDEGYNDVIEVSFNNTVQSSTFSILPLPSASLDLSAYSSGELVFNYKMVSNPNADTNLFATIQCGDWPCTGGEFLLDKSEFGVWKEMRISVAEMIDNGLDIAHVSTWFALVPTYGQPQSGIRVELDNIRWEE